MPNIIDQMSASYAKARAQTIASVLNAGGWSIGSTDPSMMVPNSVFVYVYEHSTDWCWMCSIPKMLFLQTIEATASEDVMAFASAVNHLLAIRGNSDSAWESKFGVALTGYLGKTATYRNTDKAELAPHFMVINYTKSGRVRPFAMRGSDRFALPASTVLEAFERVIGQDALHHPDWIGT